MTSGSDYRKLFIVGCPRSGTTWVQLLLSQLPTVATAPETQIFAYYLEHFRRQWRIEHEGPGRKLQGQAGLSRLLSEEEFLDLCRGSARMVLDKIAARNPSASVVCEKSPKHALQTEFIQRVFPDAFFLHVIRDPRDTAASLLAAGRSWGLGWAPRNSIEAARMWTQHVESARAVAGSARYREVQYEALKDDAPGVLGGVLEWLEIPEPVGVCQSAADACEMKKLQKVESGSALPIPGSKSPKDFFRKGSVGGWEEDLTPLEVRIVEHLTSNLMADLGYPPSRARGGSPPLRIPIHDAIQRVRDSVDWQLQRLLQRV
jgi:hypothetical protein